MMQDNFFTALKEVMFEFEEGNVTYRRYGTTSESWRVEIVPKENATHRNRCQLSPSNAFQPNVPNAAELYPKWLRASGVIAQ
jgi:hypothetical protein